MKKFLFLTNIILTFRVALMRKALDHTVKPSHYDLSIKVEENAFSGAVTMHLHADNPVSSFKFNSKDLKLENMKVYQMEDGKEKQYSCSPSENDQFVTVDLQGQTISKDFFLYVDFSGNYSTSMEGFYKSDYNGSAIYSTHFEPTDARSVFPCFDQPDMKSTFAVSIQVPKGNIALSNNKLKKDSPSEGLFEFETTPIMSTYIVAWVVGNLEFVEDKSGPIPIRVYAERSEKDWGYFSLDVAKNCLKFFEDYFQMKYPLPKLDMVAIPSFAMGAMENWGLITYRKTSLLFNEKSTPMGSKKNIANTVCHELAHMWFGNLVTMKWWSDLWLNEGFATWAASLAISSDSVQKIIPWDVWSSFINDDIEPGMKMDSLQSTHPIAVSVEDPVQIDQIFDAISYSKGASIIKMLENWLGADVFREGLINYIDTYKYSNAETQNLWDCLTKVANSPKYKTKKSENPNTESDRIDVAGVIDPWIQRDGFPYVKVEDMGDSLRLTQERFTLGHEKKDDPWPIPVRISWGQKTEGSVFVMSQKTLEVPKKSNVYKINDNVSGFFRVLYPDGYLRKIIKEDLSDNNRMNLYNDEYSMIFSLKAKPMNILSSLTYLEDENNFEVLFSGIQGLAHLRSIFYFDEKFVNFFNRKILGVVKSRAMKIDFTVVPSVINQISLDSLLVSSAVNSKDEETIERLSKADLQTLSPEYLRSYFAVKVMTEKGFGETLEFYKTSKMPGQKQQALFALGLTPLEDKIDFVFSNLSLVEPHDSIYIFASLAGNLSNRDKIVGLYMQNFEKIRKYINNSNLLGRSIEYVLSKAVGENIVGKVFAFLDSIRNEAELSNSIEKTRDSLNVSIKIRDAYKSYDFN